MWIDTADSRDRQPEHKHSERIREQVFLGCANTDTSSAELTDGIKAALMSGGNVKDLLRSCGEKLETGTTRTPCDLWHYLWILALQHITFLIAAKGSCL